MDNFPVNKLGHCRLFVAPITLDAEGHVTVHSKAGDMPLHQFVESLGNIVAVWINTHAMEVTLEMHARPHGWSGVRQA